MTGRYAHRIYNNILYCIMFTLKFNYTPDRVIIYNMYINILRVPLYYGKNEALIIVCLQ